MSELTNIDELLQNEAQNALHDSHLGVLPCEERHGGLYPQVDLGIWLRSCIEEVVSPQRGQLKGLVPPWLKGQLMMNGPGKFYFGQDIFQHLFDGSALIQKFSIEKGQVYYSCRFLRTKSFMENLKAGAITRNEFATNANSDNRAVIPQNGEKKSLSVKERLSGLTNGIEGLMSDNAMISIYPLGKNYFCFYESPFLCRLDPYTLATCERVDLNKKLSVFSHGSHPHYDAQGNMYTIAVKIGFSGPEYVIHRFPREGQVEAFEGGQPLARVRSRWLLEPGYMHSFAITENYYILVEQPMTVHAPSLARGVLSTSTAVIDAMRWHGDCDTVFHVINRSSGEATKVVYTSESFFFLHTINAYEEGGYIVIDIAMYQNPHMLHCMSLTALQTAQSDPSYAQRFRGKPHRFVLPLSPNMRSRSNLVNLPYTSARAHVDRHGHIRLTPQQLCHVGCETPTINYNRYNSKKYRYFYAITSDVDDVLSAGQVYKVDTWTGEVLNHAEDQLYCAEPIFVPSPDAQDEDDGVVVTSAIRGAPEVNYAALLVLDAKNMKELARAEFNLGGPAPKPLHGFFTGNNKFAR